MCKNHKYIQTKTIERIDPLGVGNTQEKKVVPVGIDPINEADDTVHDNEGPGCSTEGKDAKIIQKKEMPLLEVQKKVKKLLTKKSAEESQYTGSLKKNPAKVEWQNEVIKSLSKLLGEQIEEHNLKYGDYTKRERQRTIQYIKQRVKELFRYTSVKIPKFLDQ